jgi:two-component system OmpR family sensor kinase
MFSSLRSRLWLTYALLVGVVIFIAGMALVVYLVRNPVASRQEYQRLRLVASLLVQRSDVTGGLSSLDQPGQLLPLLQRAGVALNVRILILNPQGFLLVDSGAGRDAPAPKLAAIETRQAINLPFFRDAQGKIWLYVLRSLDNGDFLVVAAPRPKVQVFSIFRDEFALPFVQAGGAALILALVLAFWIAKWVAAPLQRMAHAARSLAASRSLADTELIPLEGPDEVKQLGKAFNEMVHRVQASQQSQRDFVANVSHELKTPLTSIQGFAQAILDGAVQNEQSLHQAAQVIYDESGRMHRMVMELLDLARLDSGIAVIERLPVNLTALLRAIHEKFEPIARQAQVDFRLQIDALPEIQGDGDRLEQVFTNLVDNAIKFTPPGGAVTLSSQTTDDSVRICIEDGGPGIPPEERERVFERFYQTDKSRRGDRARGVGLGLAIAREIIQAHAGSISIRDPQGVNSSAHGSVFVVKIPLARPQVPQDRKTQAGF